MTPSTVIIAFSKETAEIEPLGKVAYDINLKNVTGVSSEGEVIRHDLSELARIRTEYVERRAKFSKKKSRDRRIKQKVLARLGRREKERAKRILHKVSKSIVEQAKKTRSAIILEKLRNILSPHRRGNGESRTFRGRLHRWSFSELQRQVECKARWEGVPVEYVRATNTSKTCSNCGYYNKTLTSQKTWLCPNCGATHDRDENAARNILTLSKLGCPLTVPAGEPSR